MASKKKYSKDEAKTLSLELQAEILKLKNALSKLETDIALLQTGDKNGPYWNGSNAYEFHKAGLGHLDHDMNLLRHLESCSEYVESTLK